MRLKILHVINSLEIGGGEKLLANSLATGALPEYTDNVLVTLGGLSPLVEKVDPRVKVYNLRYQGYWQLPFLLRKIYSIHRKEKADIIHSHHNPSGLYTRLILSNKVNQVHTLHSMYSVSRVTRPLLRFLDKKILFSNKNVSLIFLSELLREDFLNLVSFRGKSYILPNFIDDIFFDEPADYCNKQSHKDTFRIVAVGNVREPKNYDFILEVFKHLKDADVSIDIFGGGRVEKIQSIIDRNKLRINLMGVEKDINSKLDKYDLFMMSSKHEAYPLSVIEAMAKGLPLFLSDIPSLKDITEGKAKFFKLDNPEEAANEIKEMAKNRKELYEMGLQGIGRAKEIGCKKRYIECLLAIYHELAS